MYTIVYKIVRRNKNILKTLYHGFHRSRVLPKNVWIKAEKKIVRDGSRKNSREYLSGIHCFKDIDTAVMYLLRFKNIDNLKIYKCYAKGLRQKPTNENVYLADELMIVD